VLSEKLVQFLKLILALLYAFLVFSHAGKVASRFASGNFLQGGEKLQAIAPA
jgi:hypothetical protein